MFVVVKTTKKKIQIKKIKEKKEQKKIHKVFLIFSYAFMDLFVVVVVKQFFNVSVAVLK